MATFSVPYGRSSLRFALPDVWKTDVLVPTDMPASPDPAQEVAQALANPVGGVALSDFQGVRSAAIAINDKTRWVPHGLLLPPLLQELDELGIPTSSIRLIIATGAHPVIRQDEFSSFLPENILRDYPVTCHNCDDEANLVQRGVTTRQTPVWINRQFLEADLRIVVGNLEPHQFQGFSGGVKGAAIGLAGRATIDHNHAMMMDANSRLGEFEANPARQDVEEIGQKVGVHFTLNTILNSTKEIVRAIAGSPGAVMQMGIPLARQICQVKVDAPYDLMIVSPGGHPKDINLYQSQKGLSHASMVTKQGGTIILAAACGEGTGSQEYEQWVQQVESEDELFLRFKQERFRVGPHKAFQIARDASRINLLLVSEMEPAFVRSLLLSPALSLEAAVQAVIPGLHQNARIGIFPSANTTIPALVKS